MKLRATYTSNKVRTIPYCTYTPATLYALLCSDCMPFFTFFFLSIYSSLSCSPSFLSTLSSFLLLSSSSLSFLLLPFLFLFCFFYFLFLISFPTSIVFQCLSSLLSFLLLPELIILTLPRLLFPSSSPSLFSSLLQLTYSSLLFPYSLLPPV